MSSSLLAPILAVAETFRISIPTLGDSLLRRSSRAACNARLDAWSKRLIRHAEVTLDVTGREHFEGLDERFVVMSNHQSLYDIPILYQAFGLDMRMVAKTELYQIPIFGPALAASEFVEVDRRNKERSWQSIQTAKERIQSGLHVWIAPEGTRSRDGSVGKFKKGGFVLAVETGTRILPVTIDGARDVLPSASFRLNKGRAVRVVFHAPINPQDFVVEGQTQMEPLMKQVHQAISLGLQAP